MLVLAPAAALGGPGGEGARVFGLGPVFSWAGAFFSAHDGTTGLAGPPNTKDRGPAGADCRLRAFGGQSRGQKKPGLA